MGRLDVRPRVKKITEYRFLALICQDQEGGVFYRAYSHDRISDSLCNSIFKKHH